METDSRGEKREKEEERASFKGVTDTVFPPCHFPSVGIGDPDIRADSDGYNELLELLELLV